MKKVIALFAIVLMAGLAMAADDKPIDTVDYSIQTPSRIEITGALDDSSPVWDRGYGYNDPTPVTCDYVLTAAYYQGQYYDMVCVESSDENPVEFEIIPDPTTVGDTVMYLFCEGFNDQTPLEQCVFYDDDDGDGLYSAILATDNVILTPGVSYWLIVSTYSVGDPDDVGVYTVVTSDNVQLCGGVGTENTDWTAVKSLFK